MNTQELPKPRCDSRLKTLSEERQDEIAQCANNNSLKQTAQWLCQCGVPTSIPAVSRFLDWYKTKQTLQRIETVTDTLVCELAKEKPELPAERLHEIGNHFFTSLALLKQDHKAWYMTEQIALRNARLKLETRKFEHEIEASARPAPLTTPTHHRPGSHHKPFRKSKPKTTSANSQLSWL